MPWTLLASVPRRCQRRLFVSAPVACFFASNECSSGHESTARASPLAKKIVAADIERGYTSNTLFYPGDNCGYLVMLLRPFFLTFMQGPS